MTGSDWKQTPGRSWRDPGFEQTERHPVVCVSHGDAEAYVHWLAQRTGAPYRLPIEAEWEYAARAGTATAYPWGADARGNAPCAYANGADQSARRVFPGWNVLDCDDGQVYTAPVGSLEPNGFGLYDMIGNALEWVEDCWHGNYEGAPTDGSAWGEAGKGDCGRRGVRGGSWSGNPRNLRSSFRIRLGSNDAYYFLGFRLARAL